MADIRLYGRLHAFALACCSPAHLRLCLELYDVGLVCFPADTILLRSALTSPGGSRRDHVRAAPASARAPPASSTRATKSSRDRATSACAPAPAASVADRARLAASGRPGSGRLRSGIGRLGYCRLRVRLAMPGSGRLHCAGSPLLRLVQTTPAYSAWSPAPAPCPAASDRALVGSS